MDNADIKGFDLLLWCTPPWSFCLGNHLLKIKSGKAGRGSLERDLQNRPDYENKHGMFCKYLCGPGDCVTFKC